MTATRPPVPGYTYGTPAAAKSPLTPADLAKLMRVMLFGDADVAALRQSWPVLEPQVEAVLDVWYGFVGSTPELAVYFTDRATGQLDPGYLAAVRRRFARWIEDTATADYDQTWLDYQYEIGLRHHRAKKNRTDGARGPELIHARYLSALTIPVVTTLKPFLANAGHTPEQVDAMHAAWVKSVLLQTILWTQPYIPAGDF
jgi:hypothetical protein